MVLGLIAAETVGEGEADGAEAGVFAAQVLACPMILGSDHHCLEEVGRSKRTIEDLLMNLFVFFKRFCSLLWRIFWPHIFKNVFTDFVFEFLVRTNEGYRFGIFLIKPLQHQWLPRL